MVWAGGGGRSAGCVWGIITRASSGDAARRCCQGARWGGPCEITTPLGAHVVVVVVLLVVLVLVLVLV